MFQNLFCRKKLQPSKYLKAFGLSRFSILGVAVSFSFLFSMTFSQPVIADFQFIRLIAPLDEPRGLCLDIPGHRDRVRLDRALSLHSCKRGIWNNDEKFDLGAFKSGKLKMPFYGLCVRPKMGQVADKVVLGSCDNEAASWIFDNAHLKPRSKPHLCLTAGPGPSRLTPGGRRLPSRHVAREVFLQVCDNQLEDRQSWTREAAE